MKLPEQAPISDDFLNYLESDNRKNEIDLEKKNLVHLLESIHIDSKIDSIAESMRDEILDDIHEKIASQKRKFVRLKMASIAAAITILMVISNLLFYNMGSTSESTAQYIEMCSPWGVRTTIMLPDGSKVTLNGGSRINYPSQFTGNNREIKFEGEAFFDITKDPQHPFIISSDNVKVKVLGTRFNVNAYAEDDMLAVTLEEGSVNVSLKGVSENITLIPNEQAIYNKKTGVLNECKVTATEYSGWMNNRFYFKSAPLSQIVKQLNRHFNVNIIIASEKLKQTTFSGDFEQMDNIDEILRIITLDQRIQYEIKKREIIINEKP